MDANGHRDTALAVDVDDATPPKNECPFEVRVNEVDGATTGTGSDQEFVELFNSSDSPIPIDLSGMHIAHSDGDGPAIDDARTIPSGVTLASHAHLYLVARVTEPAEGLSSEGCIKDAPKPCLQASWDINGAGDTAYLLSRDESTVLCELTYPPSVAPDQSWGRFPDGSTSTRAMRPTPGRSNSGGE